VDTAAAAAAMHEDDGRPGFEHWPVHDEYLPAYHAFLEKLWTDPQRPGLRAIGSDVRGSAVRAARLNAGLAGLHVPRGSSISLPRGDLAVQFFKGDFDQVEPKVPEGSAVLTNLPYGVRTAKREAADTGLPGAQHSKYTDKEIVSMFARFGQMLQRREDLEPVLALNGHDEFIRASTVYSRSSSPGQLRWDKVMGFHNGKLPVSLLKLRR
jgi:23S rRNA G2445 N2-methylase RlmL